MRRAFQLGEEDLECLNALGMPWEAVIENRTKWIILPDIRFPRDTIAARERSTEAAAVVSG